LCDFVAIFSEECLYNYLMNIASKRDLSIAAENATAVFPLVWHLR
jgi:hypothetical protein